MREHTCMCTHTDTHTFLILLTILILLLIGSVVGKWQVSPHSGKYHIVIGSKKRKENKNYLPFISL